MKISKLKITNLIAVAMVPAFADEKKIKTTEDTEVTVTAEAVSKAGFSLNSNWFNFAIGSGGMITGSLLTGIIMYAVNSR